MSDMTDEESKAYFDGRDEGFNDAKEVIKELRTRVAESNRVGYKCEHIAKDEIGGDCVHCNLVVAEGSCKSLQTRLSTLNAEIEGNGGYKDMLKGFQFKIESLESKLSTLLKASEGMEKALEKIATYGYSDAPELEQDQHQIAQAALADFRAVKEGK